MTMLAILPSPADQVALGEIFRQCGWDLHTLADVEGLQTVLGDVAPDVVLTHATLPDGSWQEVLRNLEQLPSPPPLLVCSRLADERLWAEVLNLGGWDVLTMPFRHAEVRRSVRLACKSCET